MRYENPLNMVEGAVAPDMISGAVAVGGGSSEQVITGWRYFGYEPAGGGYRYGTL